MVIVNYTPHAVRVHAIRYDHTYPPSGYVARVDMSTIPAGDLDDGTPTVFVEYGVAELPADAPDHCIVSTLFADAYRHQHGHNGIVLLVPDSGPSALRDYGQIIAVCRLIRR